jgi:hypothetical protein
VAGHNLIEDPHYATPIYHEAKAAHIIAIPNQAFRNWDVGYARKRLDGSQVALRASGPYSWPSIPHQVSGVPG